MGQLHFEGDSARRSTPGEANPEEDLVASCFGLLDLDSQIGVGIEPADEQLADRIDPPVHGVVRILSSGVVLGILVPEPAARSPLAGVVAGVLLVDALEVLLRHRPPVSHRVVPPATARNGPGGVAPERELRCAATSPRPDLQSSPHGRREGHGRLARCAGRCRAPAEASWADRDGRGVHRRMPAIRCCWAGASGSPLALGRARAR